MRFNFDEIAKISINDFLRKSGLTSHQSSSGNATKYISPFRNETNPSFWVYNNKNKWRDYGSGEYGNIIDLVSKLHNCSNIEACEILTGNSIYEIEEPKKAVQRTQVEILDTFDLKSSKLIRYMTKQRKIDYDLLMMYCCEVQFRFPNGKHKDYVYNAVGFENVLHGYELRTDFWKISTDKKCYSKINGNNNGTAAIFEGFISFLSALKMLGISKFEEDAYIMNGVGLLNIVTPFLPNEINCYTDNDNAGDNVIKTLQEKGFKINDCRGLYSGYNDANDKLVTL